MDEFEDLGGEPMDRAAAESFLHDRGTGVLSLADGDRAYGIPISYGYDAETGVVYFAFLRGGERSKKERFAEATEEASLLAYDVESPGEWHSVVVTGPIRAVADDEWGRAVDAIDADAWYPNVFRESAPTRGIGGYALEVRELTGRQGGD
jgi:nitroimidazol reductase NimA-like FMN-containing flavoprotein (pyridoxamine 5'-phosphate oxidase superfamily)